MDAGFFVVVLNSVGERLRRQAVPFMTANNARVSVAGLASEGMIQAGERGAISTGRRFKI